MARVPGNNATRTKPSFGVVVVFGWRVRGGFRRKCRRPYEQRPQFAETLFDVRTDVYSNG